MNTKTKILIVDDKVENLVSLEKILSDLPVTCVRARTGNEALARLLTDDFALALMDVEMPGMSGFETVDLMRQDGQLRHLPVIFLSAVYHGDEYKIRGVKTGGVDFLSKPIVPEVLEGKVKIFLELHRSKVVLRKEIEKRKAYEKVLENLKAQLEQANLNLEKQVDARTAELLQANKLLKNEIRERRQIETSLKSAQMKLIETEKIAAIGTLTAGIAHELNNPLMGILNFVQYAKNKSPATGRVYEILSDAESATGQCIDIIRNLLTFARVKDVSQEPLVPTNLDDIFERVFKLMSYRLEKENVAVRLDVVDNMPPVPIRETEIQQVFLNLFVNALDALAETSEKKISVCISLNDTGVRVSIADNGCGVPETHRNRIFDPFFTTKDVGKGTGLGLSICKGIVDAHHGRIVCDSETDRGTTFHVYLGLAST